MVNRISSATGLPVKEADDTFLRWITELDGTSRTKIGQLRKRDALH